MKEGCDALHLGMTLSRWGNTRRSPQPGAHRDLPSFPKVSSLWRTERYDKERLSRGKGWIGNETWRLVFLLHCYTEVETFWRPLPPYMPYFQLLTGPEIPNHKCFLWSLGELHRFPKASLKLQNWWLIGGTGRVLRRQCQEQLWNKCFSKFYFPNYLLNPQDTLKTMC